jgi:hypothetical protein
MREINDSLISLKLCHLGIDFPQTFSLGHVGYGQLSLISLRFGQHDHVTKYEGKQ